MTVSLVLGHVETGQALYDPPQHHTLAAVYGEVPGVWYLAYSGLILWMRGYPEQARARSQEAVQLAQTLAHPFSLAHAINLASVVHHLRREPSATQQHAETLLPVATTHGFPHWGAHGTMLRGWALAMQGQTEAGLGQIQQGLTAHRVIGTQLSLTYWLAVLAEGYGRCGQARAGLAAVSEALVLGECSGEQFYLAELYRLQGELLLAQGRPPQESAGGASGMAAVEGCLHQALDIARRQQAKALELRAAVSLARLWQQRGKRVDARQLLAPIYGWFTEGFDTADLQEARALLEA